MNKGLVAALLIIAVMIIVLLFNKGTVDIYLFFGTIHPLKSLAFLSFAGVGVVVGILLK